VRILFFSSMGGSSWGGSEELWAAAARAALADGHAVAVSVFDFGTFPEQVLALERAGATLIVRPRRPATLADRARQWFARPPWLGEVEAFAPDRICLSQGSAYECVGRRSTRPLLEFLERTRTPAVNVVQFNEPKHDLPGSTLARARRLHDRCHANTFVAARNIDEAAATLGAPVPRARVVRNPVNLRDTSPLPWPAVLTPAFACVARLHVDAKGQDLLLEALSTRPWRHEPWSLSLFGAGQDEARLREQVKTLGLADRVHFRGTTSDLRAVWAGHHLLVLPSRAEGTPLAMVEAMLLGRPCLVTNVGGCADWIREGHNGFLATPTLPGIADSLDHAWAARDRWAALGRAARADAERLHDPDPGRTLLRLLEEASVH
jgi:glycosyltransferase involved in cell wall biosynthesis